MLSEPEELVEWLVEHPKASISIGYWTIQITSEDFEDVDHEAYDQPFGLNGAVEDFYKSKSLLEMQRN